MRFVFQIFIGNQQLLMGNISLENKSLAISNTFHCRLSRSRCLRMMPGTAWPQQISRSVAKVLEAKGSVCQLIKDNFFLVMRRSGAIQVHGYCWWARILYVQWLILVKESITMTPPIITSLQQGWWTTFIELYIQRDDGFTNAYRQKRNWRSL